MIEPAKNLLVLAWHSPRTPLIISPNNFMMRPQWGENRRKPTDGRTDIRSYRVASLRLKTMRPQVGENWDNDSKKDRIGLYKAHRTNDAPVDGIIAKWHDYMILIYYLLKSIDFPCFLRKLDGPTDRPTDRPRDARTDGRTDPVIMHLKR